MAICVLSGAQAKALVVRTSWVFGPGRNFVAAILRQCRLRRTGEVLGPLAVVDDQKGSPTYAADLALGIRQLAKLAMCSSLPRAGRSADENAGGAPVQGIFHLSNSGVTSWWGFARAILDQTGHADLEIDKTRTADLDVPAERPLYSVLDCSRAAGLGVKMPSWRDGLQRYLSTPAGAALVSEEGN